VTRLGRTRGGDSSRSSRSGGLRGSCLGPSRARVACRHLAHQPPNSPTLTAVNRIKSKSGTVVLGVQLFLTLVQLFAKMVPGSSLGVQLFAPGHTLVCENGARVLYSLTVFYTPVWVKLGYIRHASGFIISRRHV
jgi:hypothetical protein